MGMDPITLGLGASAVGGLYGAYEKNRQAKQNQRAVQGRSDQISQAAQGMMMTGAPQGQDQLMDLISRLGRAPTGDTGSDGIMQMLRSLPGNNIDATLSGMTKTGDPFDPTSTFAGLAPRDALAVQDAVSGLRGGFAGLGQRFGSSAMREEGTMRARMAADVGARNAGIAQNAYESAQGRRLGAAQLMSGNTANLMNALLQARGQTADITQRGQSMQLSAIGQLFNQIMGQKQFNQGLLGIQAGMPVAQNNAPGYGGALGDLGQIAAFLPMLRQMSQGGGGGGAGTGMFGANWANPIQPYLLR